MPDHFHGIVQIISDKNDRNSSSEHVNAGTSLMMLVPTLFEIIGAFKSITTNRYINGVNQYNWPRFRKRLWQLRYNDRIIRDVGELGRIREYIIENPLNWERDEDNP